MLIWLTRQVLALRKAFSGRFTPHQLAGAVALGVLVGLVPHGNLLAIALIVAVVLLNVNHALVAVTAVPIAFAAAHVDPLSHRVGAILLSDPDLQPLFMRLYELPLVPWTDINNSVVLGSLLIGVMAVLPTYAVTLPLFKSWTRRHAATDHPPLPPAESAEAIPEGVLEVIDHPLEPHELERVGEGEMAAFETQIDVIRLKHPPETLASVPRAEKPQPRDDDASAEVNEALRYLVHRARQAREGKAA